MNKEQELNLRDAGVTDRGIEALKAEEQSWIDCIEAVKRHIAAYPDGKVYIVTSSNYRAESIRRDAGAKRARFLTINYEERALGLSLRDREDAMVIFDDGMFALVISEVMRIRMLCPNTYYLYTASPLVLYNTD